MGVCKRIRILATVAAALFFICGILVPFKNEQIKEALRGSELSEHLNCSCKLSELTNGNSKNREFRKNLLPADRKMELPSVCLNETCKSNYSRYLHKGDMFPIPAIRHILWRNESVSKYFVEQLRTWQSIHPDWTFVLWRDQDLEPFVATHFPGLLAKFKALSHQIMRVDMIRYMLLFKYGGIYADLDYSLVRNLDEFRRFHAVITREPEAHSLQTLGMSWPVKLLTNPAFLMSAPGHIFFHFALQQLESKVVDNNALGFAGPYGLREIVLKYQSLFPIAQSAMETLYVPPSRSFYPYKDNRLSTSRSKYIGWRLGSLRSGCHTLMSSNEPKSQQLKLNMHLRQYCTDVNNLDPITDKSQPVFAIHDQKKPAAVYDLGSKYFFENMTDVTLGMKNLTLGRDFI